MIINTALPYRYGAAELKASYNRNLAWAFLLAIVLVGSGIAAYGLLASTGSALRLPPVILNGPIPYYPPPVIEQPKEERSSRDEGSGRSTTQSKGTSRAGLLGPVKVQGGLPMPGTMPTDFDFNGRDPKGNLIGGGNGDTLGAHDIGDPKGPRDRSPSDHADRWNDRDL